MNTLQTRLPAGRKQAQTNYFTLNHWTLYYGPDGVQLVGHLHDRPGFPDGVRICTSVLCDWSLCECALLFETKNSSYRCALSEYVRESGSLPLLEKFGGADSPVWFHNVERIIGELDKNQSERYRAFFAGNALPQALLLCWQGCDTPYLKRIVTKLNPGRFTDRDTLVIDDAPAAQLESVCEISFDAGRRISVSASPLMPCRRLRSFGVDEKAPVLIENDGGSVLFFPTKTGRPLMVKPGEIRLFE